MKNNIKNVIQFIDFLHSNIAYFNSYENQIKNFFSIHNDLSTINKKVAGNAAKAANLKHQRDELLSIIENEILLPIAQKLYAFDLGTPNKTQIWNKSIDEIAFLSNNIDSDIEVYLLEAKQRCRDVYSDTITKTILEKFLFLIYDDLRSVSFELFDLVLVNETDNIYSVLYPELTQTETTPDFNNLIEQYRADLKTAQTTGEAIGVLKYFIDDLQEKIAKSTKHEYPLLSKKYDAERIYNAFFKGKIAVCTYECFFDWFINGYKTEKITHTLKGREGKPAVAQIRKFIETITENTTDLKDGYYNNVFGLKLNNINTAKKLSLELEVKLKFCEK